MSRFLSSIPGKIAAKVTVPAAARTASTNIPSSSSSSTTSPSAPTSSAAGAAAAAAEHLRPPPLDPAVAHVVVLTCAVVVRLERDRDVEFALPHEVRRAHEAADALWLEGVCLALKFDPSALPSTSHLLPADIAPMRELVPPEAHTTVLHLVLLSSIFPPPAAAASTLDASAGGKGETPMRPGDIAYSATARRRVYAFAALLGLDGGAVVIEEGRVANELFGVLRQGAEAVAADGDGGGEGGTEEERQRREEVERVRKAREEGWGGKWGRWAATGAGVVIGSVALGLTGGLAAPAILALLPTIGFLTPAAAPVVLGTLFGLTGGGLAGRRVRRRWAGVGEFEFVDVGKLLGEEGKGEGQNIVDVPYAVRQKRGAGGSSNSSAASTPDGSFVTDRFANVNLDDDGKLPSGGEAADDKIEASLDIPSRAPSLTVVIALPGLLTQSADEGVLAWQTVGLAPRAGEIRQLALPDPTINDGAAQDAFELPAEPDDHAHPPLPTAIAEREDDTGAALLRDRDLFVARIETALMLSTGVGINAWVTDKLLHKAGQEVLKRTFINAYMSAVALPLTVYGWAGTALDNAWMRAVDKAKKAGPLLAEVLLSRTQGARPVQLVGHSLGALTVLHALSTLAASDQPGAADLVDTAVLISLPSSPSAETWRTARKVVGRRLINAWSARDFVLASVVRLHEVVGNAVELRDGARVGGLSAVDVAGIENVDLSTVVDGHFQINHKLPDILRLVDLDA